MKELGVIILLALQITIMVSMPAPRDPLQNCETIAFGTFCIDCKEGFHQDDDDYCVPIETGIPDELPNPCEDREYCGEAQTFRDVNELNQFVRRYPPPPQNSPIIAFFTFGSGNTNTQVSQTNDQEQNIDEPDIVKNDGTYLYIASGRIVNIVRAYPAITMEVVSHIQLDQIVRFLFISGNYLVGLTQSADHISTIHIWDVSNRSSPTKIKTIKLEGSYDNARQPFHRNNDSYLNVIVSKPFQQRRNSAPWYDLGNGRIHIEANGSAFKYQDDYENPIYMTIFTYNLQKPSQNQFNIKAFIIEQIHTVYESPLFNYYFAYQNKGKYTTTIHKVLVFRTRFITPYKDVANVTGWIKRPQNDFNNNFISDQYALSEDQNQVLRIATTDYSNYRPDNLRSQVNSVYCFDENLTSIGSLQNITRSYGERIFASRYVGNRLYLVTFRVTDPLFAINLTNPEKPQLLGALSLPGFSTYLHPYDQDTIIGIGRRAELTGSNTRAPTKKQLKITLFDVHDPRNIKIASEYVFEDEKIESLVETDDKAFLFSKDKNLLVIPTYSLASGEQFEGVHVFRVTSDSITLKKKIEMGKTIHFEVLRNHFIENVLYTISRCDLKATDMKKNFDAIKDIRMQCE